MAHQDQRRLTSPHGEHTGGKGPTGPLGQAAMIAHQDNLGQRGVRGLRARVAKTGCRHPPQTKERGACLKS